MRIKHQNLNNDRRQKNQNKICMTSMKKIALWFLMTLLLIPCFVQAQNLSEDPRIKSALNLLEMWVPVFQ